ncbi:hypothetical protein R6Y99_01330 [Pseudomonas lundensis]|uniref:hypothetical protein n=1 Tax=Serratia proteamaculans TaxID=28151 RepID=UPI002980B98D|nr:hypothetical protein [Serratia proteamaculans]MDW5498439.1 hypothetical protein [Serratia proteamaculans]MDW5503497.1 hypothetical protein [Pseudomonas lundensis]
MAFLGFVSERECQHWQGAPPYLPAFSFYEKHQSDPINAPPEAIIQAVLSLDMAEDPIIRRLLMLRQWPGKLRLRATHPENTTPTAVFGFNTFTLLHQDSHEVSMGLAGRFWRPMMGVTKLANAQEFEHFNDPDAAKLVLRFNVTQDSAGLATLSTETFVWCPTPQVKARFACYWAAIRPASGWIRRRTLFSVQQKLAMGQSKHIDASDM